MINAFSWIMEREDEIRQKLQESMPDYCKEAAKAGDALRELWRGLHEAAERDGQPEGK